MVGSSYAGHRGSKAPKSDGRISREVEVWAGEAIESLLSAKVVCPCLGLTWPKGVKVMEG